MPIQDLKAWGDTMETSGIRDIIGPIMIGPSSSHTAGALRIAAMTRTLCKSAPVLVTFKLYGSFAHTYVGHGTDKALVAGMLGLAADDLRIRDSFNLAQEAGMRVVFTPLADAGHDHPNTVEITVVDADDTTMSVRGISVGGGAAIIDRIDNVDVSITGKHNSIVIQNHDEKGVLAHITSCIRDFDINIATARMYRERKGDRAYIVLETDEAIGETLREAISKNPAINSIRVIPAARARSAYDRSTLDKQRSPTFTSPDCAQTAFDEFDFSSGAQLLERCAKQHCSISHLFYEREIALQESHGNFADVDTYLSRVLRVMHDAATDPIKHPQPSMGGLIGGEAKRLTELEDAGSSLCDPQLARAITFAVAVLETNASMGRIVAAPTAGSSGVIPAVLFSLQMTHHFDDDALKAALSNAAAIGHLIARNATVSGAEGGCQAEIGAAAAMAASAATEMAGGTPAQCLAAASNAIANMLGLVCDPIAGLVETPCQKRNAAGAATALVSAQIALAGIENLVDFDQSVDTLYAVGRALPFELRETALGGLAATPAACAFCASCR
ncbi:MAG: L-serine ammonia-lyase, iron-sulfur-dependent, subunit alpha [Raoultibacter sp.]